jgi:hypothetical protein
MTKHKELPPNVKNYLSKRASTNLELEINITSPLHLIIVVPAISEYENLFTLINSLLMNQSNFLSHTAVIFVINNLLSSNEEIKSNNKQSIKLLRALIQKKNDYHPLIKKTCKSNMTFGLIDASSKGKELPDKEGGVGLARKIGMDSALKIFSYNSSAKNILVCLDADCTVQENYIEEIYDQYNKRNLSAAVINFEHPLYVANGNAAAIICYEIFLRYYVLGLRFANSKYAHHSIGSTITCDHLSYIKAGGMNKRKAAEDFYFLEKLSKFCEIKRITSTKVYPSSRSSWRVPFGTGQRVERFLTKIKEEYLLYNPESFVVLKKWLNVFNNNNCVMPSDYLRAAKQIHPQLEEFLFAQKFDESWSRIVKNSKTQAQIQKQKHLWFDGFRTLKLIHYLRDKAYPLVNMFDAIDDLFEKIDLNSPIKREKNTIPSLKEQRMYLNVLRKLDNDEFNM